MKSSSLQQASVSLAHNRDEGCIFVGKKLQKEAKIRKRKIVESNQQCELDATARGAVALSVYFKLVH